MLPILNFFFKLLIKECSQLEKKIIQVKSASAQRFLLIYFSSTIEVPVVLECSIYTKKQAFKIICVNSSHKTNA